MSLTSGLASLASSAAKVTRRAFGGATDSSDDDNSSVDGSVAGSSSDGNSDVEDESLAARKIAGSSSSEVVDSLAESVVAEDVVHTPAPTSSTTPAEFKYDATADVSPVYTRKLDFSDKTITKLAKALKPSLVKTKTQSRSLLPKLNYAKQISVSQVTFSAWVEQIKVYQYSRRWPLWCTTVGGSKIWDGDDTDADECIARREAYEWMETSIPETSKYILIFVKKGDAKAVYEALWKRFASLTVKELQQKFWSLEMKNEQAADQFAHVVSKAAICLSHAGVAVPDQQIATAYIQGLSRSFMMIKEKYRNLKVFSFIDVVEDATNYAIQHKISSVKLSEPQPRSSGTVLTMCKFWRMKKGCFKKDSCPLAKYHTPETKGLGWKDNESVHVVTAEPVRRVNAAVPNNTYRCHTCDKPGHFRKDCPMKNNMSKDIARNNARKNASTVSNLSLNFMMISPVSASLFSSFNLKTEWILDSGATEHICASANWISSGTLKTLSTPAQLTVGNGQVLQAEKSGTVHFNDVSLSDVLVCEQCPVNIVSEGRLFEKGLTITKTSKDGCLIKQGKNVIMTARIQNKLMFVNKALNSSVLADLRRFR